MSNISAKGTGASERIARFTEKYINNLEVEIKRLKERITALENAS